MKRVCLMRIESVANMRFRRKLNSLQSAFGSQLRPPKGYASRRSLFRFIATGPRRERSEHVPACRLNPSHRQRRSPRLYTRRAF